MKLYPIKASCPDPSLPEKEYKEAREIGAVRIGRNYLFFRAFLKRYYIAYSEIRRCFRRVQLVPAGMCCGRGELQIENLVICDEKEELAVIQLPGTRAARELMKELRARMPDTDFSAPARDRNDEKSNGEQNTQE